MIKFEDGDLTLKGDPASLLTEVTQIIRCLRLELEKKGMPEEKAKKMLLDAYKFAIAKPEDFLKLMMTHNPGEEIKWDEILN